MIGPRFTLWDVVVDLLVGSLRGRSATGVISQGANLDGGRERRIGRGMNAGARRVVARARLRVRSPIAPKKRS